MCLESEEATNINYIVFGLTDQNLNPRSTTVEESMLPNVVAKSYTKLYKILTLKYMSNNEAGIKLNTNDPNIIIFIYCKTLVAINETVWA